MDGADGIGPPLNLSCDAVGWGGLGLTLTCHRHRPPPALDVGPGDLVQFAVDSDATEYAAPPQ